MHGVVIAESGLNLRLWLSFCLVFYISLKTGCYFAIHDLVLTAPNLFSNKSVDGLDFIYHTSAKYACVCLSQLLVKVTQEADVVRILLMQKLVVL